MIIIKINYVRNVLGKTLLLRNFPRINTPFPYFFSPLYYHFQCVFFFLIVHFQQIFACGCIVRVFSQTETPEIKSLVHVCVQFFSFFIYYFAFGKSLENFIRTRIYVQPWNCVSPLYFQKSIYRYFLTVDF